MDVSRIGFKPIKIEADVQVTLGDNKVVAVGPKGALEVKLIDQIKVNRADDQLVVRPTIAGAENLFGLYRTLIQNALTGVKTGWTKSLELVGVGYRAQTSGSVLTLNVGFSHQVEIKAPAGISFNVSESKITVLGPDKYLVGEVAAAIRRVRPAEPYKGKGIRYFGEYIRKKVGKAAKAVGATGVK